MNKIPFLIRSHPAAGENMASGLQESVFPDRHEHNITEGSEFMDDAIRIEDLPASESEEGK